MAAAAHKNVTPFKTRVENEDEGSGVAGPRGGAKKNISMPRALRLCAIFSRRQLSRQFEAKNGRTRRRRRNRKEKNEGEKRGWREEGR